MVRLKNRNKQIPNGFKFLLAETGWSPPPYSSFVQICNGLKSVIRANPYLAEKHGWQVEDTWIEKTVEAYQVKVCQMHGWVDYLHDVGGVPPPKTSPSPGLFQLGKRLVAGANAVAVDWIASGAEAVPIKQAEDRARVCVVCPLNKRGDLLSFFTVPVSNAIRAAVNLKNEWKLVTPDDGHLGVCEACSCPLKLKVHIPIGDIVRRLAKESFDALDAACWIRAETSKADPLT